MDRQLKKVYWQATALLLAAHFAGWTAGLAAAIALTLVQAVHFAWLRRNPLGFEVQVRAAYLVLLLVGSLPGCWPLHVIQFAGANAFVVADYCLLARLLTLAPWNRDVPLTPALLRQVLLSPPVPGSIRDAIGATDAGRR